MTLHVCPTNDINHLCATKHHWSVTAEEIRYAWNVYLNDVRWAVNNESVKIHGEFVTRASLDPGTKVQVHFGRNTALTVDLVA